MSDYADFFKDISNKIKLEFENCRKISKVSNEKFKFICPMGNELEIYISNITILNYPLMIEDNYISNFIKDIPTFIKGVKYEMSLLHNGSGEGTGCVFSKIDKFYSDLHKNFKNLYGSLYLSDNFHRGKENAKIVNI